MEFLKAIKPYLEERFEVVSDRADLYAYFFERGLKILKPGGRLGYISSATFFKTGSGAPLRRFLRTKATIEHVVDFADLQIFEGVTTYPAILVMRNDEPAADHTLSFWKLESLPDSNFSASYAKKAAAYKQIGLTDGSWELEGVQLKALRDKIRNGRPTLKDVYGSPLYGIKTGLNEAFVIDMPTKERLCAEDPKSAELLKPFLEGKDLKRWRQESRGLWIIYIPKNRVDIEHYPAIKSWLLPFKERLEKRATPQEWYELQQAQEAYSPKMETPKIIYGHFQASPIFSFDQTGSYSNNKSYFLPYRDPFLLAYLNSKVSWFVFSSFTTAVRGGFYEATAQHIEPLPIPAVTAAARGKIEQLVADCDEKAKRQYALQLAFVRRIPDLCPAGREPSGLIATKDSGVGFPIGGSCATFGDAHRDYI